MNYARVYTVHNAFKTTGMNYARVYTVHNALSDIHKLMVTLTP